MKKRLVILGGGESGVGAALLAAARGYEVFLTDGGKLKPSLRTELEEQGISFEEGGHSIEKIMNADEVVKSPGIGEKN
ncbi:MAG: UDP-N-acetylmuramoyl-L-alanine--D-glutamate ligase, partial [Chitinophagaceae bacterium]|nr:UDP-N-acetylmuramoyl-L-alanine--D-glutamate ligase [Chitinophagaceae bacterium]